MTNLLVFLVLIFGTFTLFAIYARYQTDWDVTSHGYLKSRLVLFGLFVLISTALLSFTQLLSMPENYLEILVVTILLFGFVDSGRQLVENAEAKKYVWALIWFCLTAVHVGILQTYGETQTFPYRAILTIGVLVGFYIIQTIGNLLLFIGEQKPMHLSRLSNYAILTISYLISLLYLALR